MTDFPKADVRFVAEEDKAGLPSRILILGSPGAGKGTQARRVAQKFDIPHISTGDIFRAHMENGTDLGKAIETYMHSGQLLPDTLACKVMAERLAEPDCAKGYILDGFPRSVPQAIELDNMVVQRAEALDMVIALQVNDKEIVDRLTARRTCPNCGRIYNLKYKQPKEEGFCDFSDCVNIELVQREDDTEGTIRKRLALYHRVTEPLLAYYAKRGLREDVVGEHRSPDEIAAQIEKLLMTDGKRV